MAASKHTKVIDERHATKKGLIRIEAWADSAGNVVRYNLAYINVHISGSDNGRVFGFDNAHMYPGFASLHHMHWFGTVLEGKPFVSFDETLRRFERMQRFFRHYYKKGF